MKLIIICLIVVAAATTIGMADTDVFTNIGEYHITDYPFNEGAQSITDNNIFTSSIYVSQGSSSIQLSETSKDFTGGIGDYVPIENNVDRWNDFSFPPMGEDISFEGIGYTTPSIRSCEQLPDREDLNFSFENIWRKT